MNYPECPKCAGMAPAQQADCKCGTFSEELANNYDLEKEIRENFATGLDCTYSDGKVKGMSNHRVVTWTEQDGVNFTSDYMSKGGAEDLAERIQKASIPGFFVAVEDCSDHPPEADHAAAEKARLPLGSKVAVRGTAGQVRGIVKNHVTVGPNGRPYVGFIRVDVEVDGLDEGKPYKYLELYPSDSLVRAS